MTNIFLNELLDIALRNTILVKDIIKIIFLYDPRYVNEQLIMSINHHFQNGDIVINDKKFLSYNDDDAPIIIEVKNGDNFVNTFEMSKYFCENEKLHITLDTYKNNIIMYGKKSHKVVYTQQNFEYIHSFHMDALENFNSMVGSDKFLYFLYKTDAHYMVDMYNVKGKYIKNVCRTINKCDTISFSKQYELLLLYFPDLEKIAFFDVDGNFSSISPLHNGKKKWNFVYHGNDLFMPIWGNNVKIKVYDKFGNIKRIIWLNYIALTIDFYNDMLFIFHNEGIKIYKRI